MTKELVCEHGCDCEPVHISQGFEPTLSEQELRRLISEKFERAHRYLKTQREFEKLSERQ